MMPKSHKPLFHASILLAITIITVQDSNQTRSTFPPIENTIPVVEKYCSESLEPESCTRCIRSSKRLQFEDVSGFAISLLSCTFTETTMARDTAIAIASEKGVSSNLKRTVTICSDSLSDALKQLKMAMLSIGSSHYAEANEYYTEARKKIFRCVLEFHQNVEFTIPDKLVDPLISANRLGNSVYGFFALLTD